MEKTPDLSGTFIYAIMPWMMLIKELPWIQVLLQVLLGLAAVLIIHHVGTTILTRIAAPFPFSRRLVLYGNRTGRLVLFFVLLHLVIRDNAAILPVSTLLGHVAALALIASLTWLALRCIAAINDTIIELNPVDSADNLHARRIQTQSKVLSRTVMVVIVLLGSGMALMTLPFLRQIGASLLASAGVAGLVVGFAAKPVLGNLLAGLQLAMTQPIRLEDVVIVQNEWGWIEEITGTYVVVRIWDQRRLIVPLQWFIENPFQNWTRTTSDLLGTVTLWADYRMPLEPLRQEAERICKSSPEWDGRLCLIQVVDTNERAMQLRALVSAGDSGRAWDLRCRVREGLIHFIQSEYPEFLPRMRAEVISQRDGLPDTQQDNPQRDIGTSDLRF
ncbi:mechanosensitive ion channel [Oxalobacteraceae bacterium R-40]|uniref:Mechanosensitive ion channel n=1 Tax=Keguizhuia sedimenti TaxID=3064264 RepID=A0ABU1BS08_9BURK|nr:mechanosensitive ion channel [Oxalobacteraceae bacterium R-40]